MCSKTELYNMINEIKIEIYDTKQDIMNINLAYQITHNNEKKKELELHLKFFENKLKYEKLLLLLAEKEYNGTMNDKLRDMIKNKMKENMVERMELVEEFTEKGFFKDGDYLHLSNKCKRMYEL